MPSVCWYDIRRFFRREAEEPFDLSYPDSEPPEGMECPDTQPTSPGALDSDLGRLP